MNKGLNALDYLRNKCCDYLSLSMDSQICNSFKLIEKELKKWEEHQNTCQELYYEERCKKQEKILRIIKDRFSIQFQKANCGEKECLGYYGIMQIGINPIYIKTKEEFDLLKEVLL